MFIANVMTGGSIPVGKLLEIGTEIEGHPDNIVPCMHGGLVVSYYDGKRFDYEKFEMPDHRLTFFWCQNSALHRCNAKGASRIDSL
ncbi:hypothetical protein [Mesotoga sp.]|uniref:hypothetical protein n=1 Tax=Mesotoga sp. TaxID=2053577 RepID=UPI00345E48B0